MVFLSPQQHKRGLVLGAMTILIAYGFGFSHLSKLTPAAGKDISVIGVQGGLANSQYHAADADPAAMENVVKTFEKLSQEAYRLRPDLVVWPETAVRADVLNTESLRSRLFPDAHHAQLYCRPHRTQSTRTTIQFRSRHRAWWRRRGCLPKGSLGTER